MNDFYKQEYNLELIKYVISKRKIDTCYWRILCNQEWALNLIKENKEKLTDDCWNDLCKHKWALDFIKDIIKNEPNKLNNKCLLTLYELIKTLN